MGLHLIGSGVIADRLGAPALNTRASENLPLLVPALIGDLRYTRAALGFGLKPFLSLSPN